MTFGEGGVGDMLAAARFVIGMLTAAAPLTLFVDAAGLFEVLMRELLLMCDKGTVVVELEFLTVLTFVSDKERSFLTASGECVPKS